MAEPAEIFASMHGAAEGIGEAGLDLLFRKARTHHTWSDRPLPQDLPETLFALMRNGPTSTNTSPGRFVFVTSEEGKAALAECVSPGNRDKVLAAPMTVIVAYDPSFWELLPRLFPHADRRAMFADNAGLAQATALRNSTLQGAYLMLAARSLGYDIGAMSGFAPDKVEAAFLGNDGWKPNFLVTIGHADPAGLMPKLPRLGFADAARRV